MDVWRPVDGETLFRSARLDCALSRFPGALICERERETSYTVWMRKKRPSCGKMQIMSTILEKNVIYYLRITKRKEVLHDEMPLLRL